MKTISNRKNKSDEQIEIDESEIEWIVEARSEGYTWKQVAKKYNVSVKTLKKFLTPNR